MRYPVAALLIIFSVLAGEVSGALVGPAQGYVVYGVTIGSQQISTEMFTLNETVQPASQNGLVVRTITIASSIRNLTYSNVVNSSSSPEVFPYLVGFNNQSFSYGAGGNVDLVHVEKTGTPQIMFDSKTYTGTSYRVSVSASFSSQARGVAGNGTIVTLPSGLIYSFQIQNIDGYSASAQLLQTNLAVEVQTASSLPVGLALVSIGLLAAIAFAVPSIFIRSRKKHQAKPAPSSQPQTEEKPSYWVD